MLAPANQKLVFSGVQVRPDRPRPRCSVTTVVWVTVKPGASAPVATAPVPGAASPLVAGPVAGVPGLVRVSLASAGAAFLSGAGVAEPLGVAPGDPLGAAEAGAEAGAEGAAVGGTAGADWSVSQPAPPVAEPVPGGV